MRIERIQKILPIILTFLTFIALWGMLYFLIYVLNFFSAKDKIILSLRKTDILVGFVIYIKTSIDLAIFIGNLMHKNPGWKKRIAIEFGTALGNGLGTFFILIVWVFFKEVPILMALMIILASLLLLQMAQESVEMFLKKNNFIHISTPALFLQKQLNLINRISGKLFKNVIPNLNILNIKPLSFLNLAMFSFTIPFILGLDNFAGYVPLFSIINVYGFAIGVFAGHMLLNIGLFISPSKTVGIVKNPIILLLGGIIFIFIALFGFYEAVKILKSLLFNLL